MLTTDHGKKESGENEDKKSKNEDEKKNRVKVETTEVKIELTEEGDKWELNASRCGNFLFIFFFFPCTLLCEKCNLYFVFHP